MTRLEEINLVTEPLKGAEAMKRSARGGRNQQDLHRADLTATTRYGVW